MTVPPNPALQIKAVFLDVDGTYADFGIVPPAHAAAVRAARAAGHKVLLSTGRPLTMLPGSITGAGFDGIVASAGAYAQVHGEVLLDRNFPPDLAARAVAVLDAHDAVYILEGQHSLQVPAAAEARLRDHIEAHFAQARNNPEQGSSTILGALTTLNTAAAAPFAKVSVFESPLPMARLAAEIGAEIAVVANSIANEGPHAGELFRRGISKADGVAAAITALGVAREHSIAFGDGDNDLEMIAYAGVGVAIRGGSAQLLAIADRTAAPPSEEGLVAAFAELGLIHPPTPATGTFPG